MESVKINAERILELVEEIEKYKDFKEKLISSVKQIEGEYRTGKISEDVYEKTLSRYLKNRSKNEWIRYYNFYILQLLKEIEGCNSEIYRNFFKEEVPDVGKLEAKVSVIKEKEEKKELLVGKPKSKPLKDIKIKKEELRKFVTLQKAKKERVVEAEYSTYESNLYTKIANRFMEPLSVFLLRRYPKLWKPVRGSLRQAGVRVLSRSYISIILFSSTLIFFLTALVSAFVLRNNLTLIIVTRSMLYGFLGFVICFGLLYLYPASVVGSKRKDIKNKLPFAIIHMAAIAGSGEEPVKMFDLVLKSEEYGELSSEIKKIMNYVNLFGYNLSTALKRVALSTPSEEFKELLNGITATIETGGDLKLYLQEKATDTLNTYRLEREKYTEAVSTYSDIYAGILIAAPLLFVVILSVMNAVGATLGGLSINAIASIGTFLIIPFLNIAFILFLNITQPEL